MVQKSLCCPRSEPDVTCLQIIPTGCIADTHVPDDVFELVRQQFSEKELADLTLAIVAINGWNRLAVAFRKVPGFYQPAQR